MKYVIILVLLQIVLILDVSAFIIPSYQPLKTSSLSILHAKKQKKKKSTGGGGGGFGSKPSTSVSKPKTVSADKQSLETQWDTFMQITELEIEPKGNPEDEDYQHFIVGDVFVRIGSSDNDKDTETGWYRTGKIVASGDSADLRAAITIQKGLILWTAVHMWPALAAKGKDAAKLMEIGIMPPTLNMADDTDTPLDKDEAEHVLLISKRVPVSEISIKTVGFRPDFNPPGFTYKRREKAAMKKKRSALEEISDAS